MSTDQTNSPKVSRECAVSTGSTLLNLACSDNPYVGFIKGKYYYIVGDSASGKTWISLTCFAEACLNPAFDDYDLIFDDVEDGALMDFEYYFGKKMADRLRAPRYEKGQPVMSDTIESFYYNLNDAIQRGKPFIYVLDSQDSLTSSASEKKFNKQKAAAEANEESKGSYGDGKAKYHSEHLRLALAGIRKLGAILIIIGQTRDNPTAMFGEKKTRSGGRSLRFYATLEIWTSPVLNGKIQREVRGKKRTIGNKCLAEVKKNRFTGKIGKDRSVIIPFYYNSGIDDIGSCVDYLVSEKHWKKHNGVIDAADLGITGKREDVIQQIESQGLERKLRKLVGRVWREIESACIVERKRRYV